MFRGMHRKTFLGALAIAGAAALSLGLATPADATHWRGGNISWTQSGNQVSFDVTSYWRRSFFATTASSPYHSRHCPTIACRSPPPMRWLFRWR